MLLRVGRNSGDGGAGVLLEVIDSGPGIAAAEYDKVFMPFYRAQATLEANPGGTGLGLAIVRDIAAMHGATMALAGAESGSGLKVSVMFGAAVTNVES